ncbi:hypothetical protein ACL03H_17550 [Saccharopolyspora sp. MS10]|uniref:hypothetical protein n=1 Tax=Saccharopolyspora sp. MS10 TaxID=3385973 RepID=UPI00399F53B0
MDPRDRADEAFARARARGAFVVTPDNATSPMDASTTVRIPRTVVAAADGGTTESERTTAIPQPAAGSQPQRAEQNRQQDGYGWPAEDYGQQLPPNPYQAQRGAGQFGPLGSRAARNQPY